MVGFLVCIVSVLGLFEILRMIVLFLWMFVSMFVVRRESGVLLMLFFGFVIRMLMLCGYVESWISDCVWFRLDVVSLVVFGLGLRFRV